MSFIDEVIAENEAVIIFGCLGSQGSSVLKHLYASSGKKLDIYAVTRSSNSPRARQVVSVFPGVQVLQGDFEDAESIKGVFKSVKNVRSIFLMSTPSLASQGYVINAEHEVATCTGIIDIAAKSGIRHIVYSSVASCENEKSPSHHRSKKRIEDHLKASGVR